MGVVLPPGVECCVPFLAVSGVPAVGVCYLADPVPYSRTVHALHLPRAGGLLRGLVTAAVYVQPGLWAVPRQGTEWNHYRGGPGL